MSTRDRLRGLEDRLRDYGPTLEEVRAAFERRADSAWAKLAGEPMVGEQRRRDSDIVQRW